MTIKVGYIVGSPSKESINRVVAEAMIKLAPASLEFSEIEIANLPLYNRDFDDNYPAESQAFKDAVQASDALLIITPEYNRSIPGGLKNALDTGCRPWGTNSFAGKPAAIMGVSPGTIGTSLAQRDLRGVLSFLDVDTMNQPEVYLQFTEDLINDAGEIADESTAEFLTGFLEAFAAHAAK